MRDGVVQKGKESDKFKSKVWIFSNEEGLVPQGK